MSLLNASGGNFPLSAIASQQVAHMGVSHAGHNALEGQRFAQRLSSGQHNKVKFMPLHCPVHVQFSKMSSSRIAGAS